MRANKLETALSRDRNIACLAPSDMVFFVHILCVHHYNVYLLFICLAFSDIAETGSTITSGCKSESLLYLCAPYGTPFVTKINLTFKYATLRCTLYGWLLQQNRSVGASSLVS